MTEPPRRMPVSVAARAVARWLAALAWRMRVTLGYLALLLVVTLTLTRLGPAAVACAVLGALTLAVPRRARLAWVAVNVALLLVALAANGTFTDVGHLLSFGIGLLLAGRVQRPAALRLPDPRGGGARRLAERRHLTGAAQA